MTGADILADTNAAIAWIKKDPVFARAMVSWSAPAISLFTLGELVFGALKSTRREQNRAAVERAKKSFVLVLPTERTSEVYAEIRFALRTKGRPIPENDLWIASLAIEYNLPLLTRDGHFREVDGLTVESW